MVLCSVCGWCALRTRHNIIVNLHHSFHNTFIHLHFSTTNILYQNETYHRRHPCRICRSLCPCANCQVLHISSSQWTRYVLIATSKNFSVVLSFLLLYIFWNCNIIINSSPLTSFCIVHTIFSLLMQNLV